VPRSAFRCRRCSSLLPDADAGCPACGATGPHPRAAQAVRPGERSVRGKGPPLRELILPTMLLLLVASLLFAVLVFLFAVLELAGSGPGSGGHAG